MLEITVLPWEAVWAEPLGEFAILAAPHPERIRSRNAR
jgi:hypothetical protein